jgi:SAM-dependent methyltransferase
MINNPEFDQYAGDYDAALSEGIGISGEAKEFFARGRITWLKNCLERMGGAPSVVMDFGCGTGDSAPLLLGLLKADSVLGVDVSPESIKVARRSHGGARARFLLLDQYQPDATIDLVFCNGVFHHIPPELRADALGYVYRSLQPGGLFAFWENNPLNPGTRYVMRRCPFDQNAVTLTHFRARRLLTKAGFDVLLTNFLFIFPHRLRYLRSLEPPLSRWPIGGQYLVLCRKQ